MVVTSKIESGCCRVGGRYLLMPNRIFVQVTNIKNKDNRTCSYGCAEYVTLKLKNIKEVSLFL